MKEMGTESTLIVSLFLPSTLSSSNSPGVSNGSKTAESPVRQFPDLPSLSYYHHRPLSSGGGTLKRARTLTTSTAIEAKELVPSLSGNIGLHNAIASVPASAGLPRNKWIGSLDVPTESWTEATREAITKKLAAKGQIPVFLSDSEMEGHYNQFCKQVRNLEREFVRGEHRVI